MLAPRLAGVRVLRGETDERDYFRAGLRAAWVEMKASL